MINSKKGILTNMNSWGMKAAATNQSIATASLVVN